MAEAAFQVDIDEWATRVRAERQVKRTAERIATLEDRLDQAMQTIGQLQVQVRGLEEHQAWIELDGKEEEIIAQHHMEERELAAMVHHPR